MNPITIETVTEDGTRLIITPMEGVNLPSTLSGIASSIKNISMPSNKDIDRAVKEMQDVIDEESTFITSKAGLVLAKDAKNVLDCATNLLHSKNQDEKLQRWFSAGVKTIEMGAEVIQNNKEEIKETAEKVVEKGKEIAEDAKKKGKKIVEKASKKVEKVAQKGEKVKEDAEDLLSLSKSLAFNFLKSDEFRNLTADWIRLFQALGAEKIKKQARKKRKLDSPSKATKNIAAAIEQGIEEPEKPASEEELMENTERDFNLLLDKIYKSEEYKKAIKDFYKLFGTAKEKILDVGDMVIDDVEPFKKSIENTMDIIAEFVGKDQLDEFKEMATDAYDSVIGDKKLTAWFSDLQEFMVDSMDKPLELEERKEQVSELLSKGRQILAAPKWRKALEEVYERAQELVDNVKNDRQTKAFTDSLGQFGQHFALNNKGYPDVFVLQESLSQLKNMIVGLVKKQLDNMAIKKIEIYNENYDVILEDLTAVGSSFLPEKMDIKMSNHSFMDFKDEGQDLMNNRLKMTITGMKPEFKDFKFQYTKKTFPTINDFGRANLAITGDAGCTIKFVWRLECASNVPPKAILEEATCTIESMDIGIVGEATKHEILDTLFAPFVAGILKNKLAHVIEEYLGNQLQNGSDNLNRFFQTRPTEMLKDKAIQLGEQVNQMVQDTIEAQ